MTALENKHIPGPDQRPLPLLRFPLFGKIVGGFIVTILFLLLSMVIIVMRLQPILSNDRPEFKSLQVTQELSKLVLAERERAEHLVGRSELQVNLDLDSLSDNFRVLSDSLLKMTTRTKTRDLIDSVRRQNRDFIAFAKQQVSLSRTNQQEQAIQNLREGIGRTDSISQLLNTIREYYYNQVGSTLKTLDREMGGSITTAQIILVLALVVSLALSIIIAKTLTKPIQALKAGTEKVGEGKYENLPITTSDEVADLTLAFNLMSDKLRHLEEMRTQLMSEISHEMRTPLQVIKAGCYSIMHAKDATPLVQRQRDAVAMIHQATNRINQFVNSFLDIAKMEAGLMKFNFQSVSLVEVLTPLVQEAQLIAQTRNIDFKFEPGTEICLSLDKERMTQAFSNLLSNALKYTPDRGTISLRVTQVESFPGINTNGRGCVRVDVRDSGVGIPEADLGKLFQKFYQAKNVPLVNEKGSGLGLALVKHVAEAHGGKVGVESEVGSGSMFSIILPVHPVG